MTSTRRIVIISDWQIPYHHPGATQALLTFIRKIKPDALACVGDEADLPMVSRWTDGSRGEYSTRIQNDLDATHEILKAFRAALGEDKPFHLVRSNHTDRLERYIERKAPAIASLRGLTYPELIRIKELNITWHPKMAEIAPNVLLAHGDEGNISKVSGMTALKLMEMTGKSIVCGHTHRQGLVWSSKGFNGRVESRFGMEVGHLMRMSQAGYLKPRGAANWQLGFGMLEISGKFVSPSVIPMRSDGSFIWSGKIYSPE
ncbi:MAG: metallophosphoesterase [Micrococcales bacterium]|nr:metallophosphoesterase [Micrococcales bacterium]